MKKHSGFTLIEAVFAVLIASVVLGFMFDYFQSSVRSYSHSEDTMNSMEEIQKLQAVLHHRLSLLTPFHKYAVDLFHPLKNTQNPIRFYPWFLHEADSGGTKAKSPQPQPLTKKFKETKPDEWESLITIDPWFQNQDIRFAAGLRGLENALTTVERDEISEGKTITVTDHCIFSQNEKYIFTHWPPPVSIVELRVLKCLDTTECEYHKIATFGEDKPGKPGRIQNLILNPVFEFSTYIDPQTNQKVVEFLRYLVEVKISVGSNEQKAGLENRILDTSFVVIPPEVNFNRLAKGRFP